MSAKTVTIDVSNPDELIDKVARALCRKWNGQWSRKDDRIQYRFDAHAALKSLGLIK